MPHRPVFISYARNASRDHAVALHEILGDEVAFLDTEGIGDGDRFPETIVDALFGARVVVIFAEPVYFTRWYCLLEFRIARTPFLRIAERPGSTQAERDEALRGIVIAFPPDGVSPEVARFPAALQAPNWPKVTEPKRIADLVMARLASNPPTLRERYEALGDADAARAMLLEATRLPPPLRIGSIPSVPVIGLPPSIGEAFVGRADDLWRIHDVLTTERGDVATAAGLTGSLEAMGGFGKTRLALEYLYRFGPRHWPGGLFWINAEQDAELQLYDVLQALKPDAPAIAAVRETPGAVNAAVARAIKALPGDRRPLFIIDNVPEPEPGQPPKPLSTWCPVLGEVPVLATSRTRVSLGGGGSVIPLAIETLEPEAAVLLLTREVARSDLSDAEWREVTQWVGHLPLALELLNRMIAAGAMSARAVLEMSRDQSPNEALDKGMEAIRNSVPPGRLRGISEAFKESYDRLNPEEQFAARLIAWMAPEPIPEFVIEEFGTNVFSLEARAVLHNRSFVTKVQGDSSGYFGSMHRVLGDFVLSQSSRIADEFDYLSSTLMSLLDATDRQGDTGSRIAWECYPLISAVLNHRYSLLQDATEFRHVFWLANSAGIVLENWGRVELAGALFGRLSKEAARWLGEEHPDTLGSMSNFANNLNDRGDHARAQELQERILEARQRNLGEQHPDTLVSMINLANVLSNQGDYASARMLQERTLKAIQRVHGAEHSHTLTAMGNLAATLFLCRDFVEAQELQERVLEITRRTMGEQHRDTLRSMNNLSGILFKRGNYLGAKELQEKVLEARRHILGEEHPKTATSMLNLSITLMNLGDGVKAQHLQEAALHIFRERLGNDHPDTTQAAWHLLQSLLHNGDLPSAKAVFDQDLAWLFKRDPDSLAYGQKVIRARLSEILASKKE